MEGGREVRECESILEPVVGRGEKVRECIG